MVPDSQARIVGWLKCIRLTSTASIVQAVPVDNSGCVTQQPPDPGWDRPAAGPRVHLDAVASIRDLRDRRWRPVRLRGLHAWCSTRGLVAAHADSLRRRWVVPAWCQAERRCSLVVAAASRWVGR
jgi:hypothetical protein